MKDIATLPNKPGCYLFLNSKKKIIYIGKAKNLKKRVSSYFQKSHDNPKTQVLVEKIVDIDVVITDTETEALLLESRLIKQYRPKFNIELKDNERYAYIKITNEKYPRILTARKKAKSGEFFGPYTSGYNRYLTIKTLNAVFQLRTCKTLPSKVCLNYHIGLCSGPCQDFISRKEYLERVQKARAFLQGKSTRILTSLQDEMKEFAKQKRFEMAKVRRDQYNALSTLTDKQKIDTLKEFDADIIAFATDGKQIAFFVFNIERGTINKRDQYLVKIPQSGSKTIYQEFIMQYYQEHIPPKTIYLPDNLFIQKKLVEQALSKDVSYTVNCTVPKKGDYFKLLQMAMQNAEYVLAGDNPALLKLKETLKLPTVPFAIECFDISNLGDTHIVGAKVHFSRGEPDKSQYRRYKIKWSKQQNDFAAMYEVLYRRLYAITKGEQAPDLIVIDGGRIQLDYALKALKELDLRIPMIALAKKEEEIHFPGLVKPLKTQKNKAKDEGIRLLTRIRDETHRFVISYHRHLRDTKSLSESL